MGWSGRLEEPKSHYGHRTLLLDDVLVEAVTRIAQAPAVGGRLCRRPSRSPSLPASNLVGGHGGMSGSDRYSPLFRADRAQNGHLTRPGPRLVANGLPGRLRRSQRRGSAPRQMVGAELHRPARQGRYSAEAIARNGHAGARVPRDHVNGFLTIPGLIWAVWVVGLRGLEPRTSSLSGKRSNRLSYSPSGAAVPAGHDPARLDHADGKGYRIGDGDVLFGLLERDLDAAAEVCHQVVDDRAHGGDGGDQYDVHRTEQHGVTQDPR
jgi:hypothetical protein